MTAIEIEAHQFLDWMVRVATPAFLRAVDEPELAAQLRQLPQLSQPEELWTQWREQADTLLCAARTAVRDRLEASLAPDAYSPADAGVRWTAIQAVRFVLFIDFEEEEVQQTAYHVQRVVSGTTTLLARQAINALNLADLPDSEARDVALKAADAAVALPMMDAGLGLSHLLRTAG